MNRGNSLESLFVLNNCKSRRCSSFDRSGGNHDWMDIEPGELKEIADITGSGIIRHIWFTSWVGDKNWVEEKGSLRKTILRIYWDEETEPSVEVPLGDFFSVPYGLKKSYFSEAFLSGAI